MPPRIPHKESMQPTLAPREAVRLLQRQIDRTDALKTLARNDPALDAWQSSTINILNAAFGQPNGEMHRNTREFANATSGLPVRMVVDGFGPPDMRDGSQERHVLKIERRKALLESFVEQLEDFAPPVAEMPAYPYAFHPEIERVSGQLFRDGHYKQAAFEAYVCVITAVRAVTESDQDGDRLMNLRMRESGSRRSGQRTADSGRSR
jgi:hypothetical protein